MVVFATGERTRRRGLGRRNESISDPVFGAGSLSARVVPMTPGNAVRADPVEERGASLYRIVIGKHGGILKPESVSTKQERIAMLAKEDLTMVLCTLGHYIDYEFIRTSTIWSPTVQRCWCRSGFHPSCGGQRYLCTRGKPRHTVKFQKFDVCKKKSPGGVNIRQAPTVHLRLSVFLTSA